MTIHRVYVGLGSNLGDRRRHLIHGARALKAMAEPEGFVLSEIYETAPVDCRDPEVFLNAVCGFNTSLPAETVLAHMLKAEDQLGRHRPYANAPRPLDCDMLFYGDRLIHNATLVVPHPRAHLRHFVLVPLAQLDGGLMHPQLGQSIDGLLARLGRPPEDESVMKSGRYTWPNDLIG